MFKKVDLIQQNLSKKEIERLLNLRTKFEISEKDLNKLNPNFDAVAIECVMDTVERKEIFNNIKKHGGYTDYVENDPTLSTVTRYCKTKKADFWFVSMAVLKIYRKYTTEFLSYFGHLSKKYYDAFRVANLVMAYNFQEIVGSHYNKGTKLLLITHPDHAKEIYKLIQSPKKLEKDIEEEFKQDLVKQFAHYTKKYSGAIKIPWQKL